MRLIDVCEINPKAKAIGDNTEVSFVAMPDVSEDGKINTDLIRPYCEVKKGFTCFNEGDVLFAKITPCMENGKGALAVGLKNGIGCGSTEFHVLRPNTDVLQGKWLYYLTAWPAFRKEAERHMTGSAGQKRVPKAYLEKYELQIPTLSEQYCQIEVLDRVKAIIELRKQELQSLDELIKARFVEMFGDPELNPKEWPVEALGDVLSVEPQNGLYKPQSDYVQDGTGIPILRIDAFYDGKVTGFSGLKRLNCTDMEKNRYLLKENDIVINRVNSIEYLGKCAWITGMLEPTVFESNMMRFHADESIVDPCYMTRLLCSTFINKQILNRAKKAVNQASINQRDVQSFSILLPPIELQKSFSTFVAQVDKSKFEVQRSLDEAQKLFDSLMQEYFS